MTASFLQNRFGGKANPVRLCIYNTLNFSASSNETVPARKDLSVSPNGNRSGAKRPFCFTEQKTAPASGSVAFSAVMRGEIVFFLEFSVECGILKRYMGRNMG